MKPNQSRNKNQNTLYKLFRFGFAALLFAMVGFLVVVGAFPTFSIIFSGTENWSLLDGYASVVSLSLLLGGLAFAFAEYSDKENAKEREKAKLSYDMYQTIFEKLTAPEQEAARRWILSNIKIKKDEEDIVSWYQQTHAKIMERETGVEDDLPEGQRSVKLTLNCFDYIGFIANQYWDIEEDSLDWLSPPIAKVWKRIGPYVAHVRTLRGAKDYYVQAEQIGNRCIQWRKDRGLPDEEYSEKTP